MQGLCKLLLLTASLILVLSPFGGAQEFKVKSNTYGAS
jgi:hypothetical protein